MEETIYVIYHSADYDGIFCREIAIHFKPSSIVIGWNFGDCKIPMPKEGMVYIFDLPPECLDYTPDDIGRIIWIDHHKSSIEKYQSKFHGYRIDGVAACRLAWQWFYQQIIQVGEETVLPEKQAYIDRVVNEPLAIRLVGEYDIWDKRDTRADTFQYGLRTQEEIYWADLIEIGTGPDHYALNIVKDGTLAQRYAKETDASICRARTWLMEWEGLKFLCVNSARFNSLFFSVRDNPETGHDALLGFCFDGKCWTVSLYHANHRKDLDLSKIAVKHGGGGHKGACGFTCKILPFQI